MNICFPMESKDDYMEAVPYGHFGSAEKFVIFNTKNDGIKIVDNNNQHHAHGACNPLQALNNATVDAVVVGDLGARALMKLSALGIKVFSASKNSTLKEHIELFKKNKLIEITENSTCNGHGHQYGCH
ncbi:MAG TPA: NifB/NifX family molybdenum-iron cluster-binding protein [Victivallales bacterium]|nr:NifB/NifX family molybdenum-iron cluster-binding protein [Victivallales bacterium]